MPTPTKGPRLGGGPAHERLMLANLATALFEHGRITTTTAKAKRLRPLAERLVTFAKRGDLHARRQVLTVVRDKGVVHTLFAEIGPQFAQRPGGYTRALGELGANLGEQRVYDALVPHHGEHLPASVQVTSLGEGDEAFRQRSQPLGLGRRGRDPAVLEQRGGQVRQHQPLVRGAATEAGALGGRGHLVALLGSVLPAENQN